ncbi:MAG: dihydroorotate dehydrogenase [Actinomycetota bacterium]|nr:dihydroorotate dehydrogenase [Actinomycetota bacterium]
MAEDKGIDIGVELTGIRLKNPVMVCSGTYGVGREYSDWMDPRELGALMTKAVTLKPCAGNPTPRLWEVPCGLLNSIGLENRGLKRFLEDDLPWLHEMGLPVWVNVAGFSREEYVKVASEVSRSSLAAALELNISCPNVEKGGMYFSNNPRDAAMLVSSVREMVDIPLYVKLSPRSSDIKEMAIMMQEAGADGLSMVNTFPAMALDIETARPRLANVTGGLSGPALHPIAVMAVWEVAGAVDLPIIGMGGIWSWRDAVEMMMAGAVAVAVGTLNFVEPGAPLGIIDGMRGFMRRKGIEKAEQLVGMARRMEVPRPGGEYEGKDNAGG